MIVTLAQFKACSLDCTTSLFTDSSFVVGTETGHIAIKSDLRFSLLSHHSGPVQALKLHKGLLFSLDSEGHLAKWNMDGTFIQSAKVFSEEARNIEFNENSCFVSGFGIFVNLVNLTTLEIVKTLNLCSQWISSSAIFNSFLYFSTFDDEIIKIDFNLLNPVSLKLGSEVCTKIIAGKDLLMLLSHSSFKIFGSDLRFVDQMFFSGKTHLIDAQITDYISVLDSECTLTLYDKELSRIAKFKLPSAVFYVDADKVFSLDSTSIVSFSIGGKVLTPIKSSKGQIGKMDEVTASLIAHDSIIVYGFKSGKVGRKNLVNAFDDSPFEFYSPHKSAVCAVSVFRNSAKDLLVTADVQGYIFVHNFVTFNLVKRFSNHMFPVHSISNFQNKIIAVSEGILSIITVDDYSVILIPLKSELIAIHFKETANFLLIEYKDMHLDVWNVPQSILERSVSGVSVFDIVAECQYKINFEKVCGNVVSMVNHFICGIEIDLEHFLAGKDSFSCSLLRAVYSALDSESWKFGSRQTVSDSEPDSKSFLTFKTLVKKSIELSLDIAGAEYSNDLDVFSLMKYWCEPRSRVAALDLLKKYMFKLDEAEKKSLIASIKSDIYLAILCTIDESVFDAISKKQISDSLIRMLVEDRSMIAMELLCDQVWLPLINIQSIARLLFTWIKSNPKVETSLLSICGSSPKIVFSVLFNDYLLSKSFEDKKSGLIFLQSVVRQYPEMLTSYLVTAVDAVIKTLDPHFREKLQSQVTSTLYDLVHTYSCIAFEKVTQKLAVGSLTGQIVLYDLRNASKLMVCEGHLHPVTSCRFSPNGKMLASFSLEEGIVRFWHLIPGFFSLVNKPFRSCVLNPAFASACIASKKFRLVWQSDKIVELFIDDHSSQTFTVI